MLDSVFSQLLGFIMGILSSWIFWYLLINVKPNIEISPVVSFNVEKGTISVRIINRGKNQANDIQVEIFVAEKRSDKSFAVIHVAQLRYNNMMALSASNSSRLFWWEFPKVGLFTTYEGEKIFELLSEETTSGDNQRRIVFTLSATDGLSGSKVAYRKAYSLQEIKHGKFAIGETFIIEEHLPQQDGVRVESSLVPIPSNNNK